MDRVLDLGIAFGIAYGILGLVFLIIVIALIIYMFIQYRRMDKRFEDAWNNRKATKW